ncbi:1155_t:CDS:2, partial [Paraglomus brasilianum]
GHNRPTEGRRAVGNSLALNFDISDERIRSFALLMALLVSHSISYVNSTSFLSQLVLGRGQPNILNEAKKPIFEMMQGDTSDKIGGILAIGVDPLMILAAKALGKIWSLAIKKYQILTGGPVTAVFVQSEANIALEYLQ